MRDGTLRQQIYFDGSWYDVISQTEVANETNISKPGIAYHVKQGTFNTITDLKGIRWIIKDADYEKYKEQKQEEPTDNQASEPVL